MPHWIHFQIWSCLQLNVLQSDFGKCLIHLLADSFGAVMSLFWLCSMSVLPLTLWTLDYCSVCLNISALSILPSSDSTHYSLTVLFLSSLGPHAVICNQVTMKSTITFVLLSTS